VAHHVGRMSITEQTNGRAMDAQPKPNRRLVPGREVVFDRDRVRAPARRT
jgi:hypothetical protein